MVVITIPHLVIIHFQGKYNNNIFIYTILYFLSSCLDTSNLKPEWLLFREIILHYFNVSL
eukprot:UN08761